MTEGSLSRESSRVKSCNSTFVMGLEGIGQRIAVSLYIRHDRNDGSDEQQNGPGIRVEFPSAVRAQKSESPGAPRLLPSYLCCLLDPEGHRTSTKESTLYSILPDGKHFGVMPVRILVADDHDLMRGALSKLLSRTGDHWEICAEVPTGAAAVEKAAQLKPDVAILDLFMPQGDGITAGRAIHEMLPNTPLLLYTIAASPALETDARRAGFHAVIDKSSASSLIAAIRAALASRSFRFN